METKKIDDTTFHILWDKWKTGNSLIFDRYNRFLTLQIAVIGWVLFDITSENINASESTL
ncbi:MAG: hypothetical protein HOF76_05100 [Candidatus Scalindua sp.]|jgi:hypothetical protein|nr:hypothetical protein [Candidatus Scalindua sp.]MBT7210379.1 hypothetical protein [Candidatus Scalindua sp.]MBT7591337.1 hypothetical protein [Candidatus Scalindua sp.]